ncbi:hypothetical protein BESB_040240 [Besnoitia besnoiti]|uniref:Uncharacterized protein n=1 Tax=Besnoitia besnoiti TaxID=94643 RepID=A0A2A9MN30_BESBE|nr:hypothetical protein BESB_040240 [Besnoitia besnoiti]PFH37566.1 hypothetical protein BESB_040240 [Besnoitia besnoiti]
MSSPQEFASIEQALNKNDAYDLKKMDTFVDKAEMLETKRLPEKHEHDKEATGKMVAFERRNSAAGAESRK